MRTSLNLDEHIIVTLMQLTHAKTKTDAVRQALSDYVRLKQKEELLALRGALDIADTWKELRSLEIVKNGSDAKSPD